jgi:hypothetical protein
MVDPMPPDKLNLAAMADELGKSPDYRVLRRLVPGTEYASSDGHATKTGIMLDVETTPVFDSSLVSPIECCRTFASAELM